MTWDTFYDRFWDWSESTQRNRISSLTSFGPLDEVCEVAESFTDEKVASCFIRKAVANGVVFNAEDVYHLEGVVEESLHKELLQKLNGNMDWAGFYEHIFDWPDQVQAENAIAQKEFGPADQVCEVAENLLSEDAATVFIKNAIAAGVRFTAQSISDTLVNCVSESYVPVLVNAASTKFTEDEFDIIAPYLDDMSQQLVAEKSGIVLETEIEEEDFAVECALPMKHRRFSLFGFAASLFLAALGVGRKSKKSWHNGHCDGDCANCPPHYGYRYGRWYYGRDHHYGCQFGGNHGGGGIN